MSWFRTLIPFVAMFAACLFPMHALGFAPEFKGGLPEFIDGTNEFRRVIPPPPFGSLDTALSGTRTSTALAIELQGMHSTGLPDRWERFPGSPVSRILVHLTYNDGTTLLLPLRSDIDNHRYWWEVRDGDRITSAALTIGNNPMGNLHRVFRAHLIDASKLPPPARLLAHHDQPLQLASPATVIRDGKMRLIADIPASWDLDQLPLGVRITDGETADEYSLLQFGSSTQYSKYVGADVPISALPNRGIIAELLVSEKGVKSVAWKRTIQTHPLDPPFLELAGRSIEDFSAIERGGELAIYSAVGDEGADGGSLNSPALTDAVWLSVGDGVKFPVSEPMLRSMRNVDWLAGGPRALAAGMIGKNVYMMFTTVHSDGAESLSIASSLDSLRLTPIAQNPIWQPQAGPTEVFASDHKQRYPPMLHGNTFFELNGAKLDLSLMTNINEEPKVRALISDALARWIDLGDLPLSDLDPHVAFLSGVEFEGRYYLLAGPKSQLFESNHPLRNWKIRDVKIPKSDELQKLVKWKDKLWIFSLKRVNDQNVIVWEPLDLNQPTESEPRK
ncbi:hypothetical protein BH09SUM1_BH09SUM1_30130 [soil metagenome]